MIQSLASDLEDSLIDGVGGHNADERLAAVSNVVASQVVLETMRGALQVNNVDASSQMNNAIFTSLPDVVVSTTINDVSINAAMIDQAVTNLTTASTTAQHTDVAAILDALNLIRPGSRPEEAAGYLSDNIMNDMALVLDNTVAASHAGTDPANEPTPAPNEPTAPAPENPAPAENTAPTISGSPASTVQQGNTYSFTPSAEDQDGDKLTFSITNKPAWASFNTATGRLNRQARCRQYRGDDQYRHIRN